MDNNEDELIHEIKKWKEVFEATLKANLMLNKKLNSANYRLKTAKDLLIDSSIYIRHPDYEWDIGHRKSVDEFLSVVDDYEICGTCNGSGVRESYPSSLSACNKCDGSGLVDDNKE